MLTVDLGRLSREGELVLDESIPADAGLWNGLDFRFGGPVRVRFRLQPVGSKGDVLARGTVSGALAQECRRCLVPLETPVDLELGLYYEAQPGELGAGEGDVYPLPERGELDLGPALREQVALALPAFPQCRDECRGLCPQCGVNRNETDCECGEATGDDRWAALRGVKFD